MTAAQAKAMPFRPRERRLALVAACVIGCWVLVSWVVQPLWNRAGELRRHVETQTEKLEKFSRLLAEVPALERERQRLAGYLRAENEEQAQSGFLNDLEALSRQSNLHINLKPRPMKREGQVSRFEVELDLEGSQESLLAFLDALLRLPRLVQIERLRLSSVPTKEQLLRADLVVQKLTLQGP